MSSSKIKTKNTNFTTKKNVQKLLIDDRVQTMEEKETAHITIKDHKNEFLNKIPC